MSSRRRNRRNRDSNLMSTTTRSLPTTASTKSIPSSGIYVRMMNDYLYRMIQNDETVYEIEEIVE
jgi:hypothetical protein